MVDVSTSTLVTRPARPKLDGGTHPSMAIAFLVLLVGGIIFTGYHLYADIQSAHVETTTWIPFLFLALALFIALGFEFVNGFHDTANAVATVIYTHSLPPIVAVIWSGVWNFLGVLLSSGAGGLRHHLAAAGRADPAGRLRRRLRHGVRAADRRDHLEPRHLVSGPAGLELAHADRFDHRRRHRQPLMPERRHQRRRLGQATKSAIRCCSLRWSALSARRCCCSLLKFLVRNPALYAEPKGDTPPPLWIRGILVLTCTGVSFAHGSNDGQKGMGLIMLILIGIVPTAYALNRAMPTKVISRQFAGGDGGRPAKR